MISSRLISVLAVALTVSACATAPQGDRAGVTPTRPELARDPVAPAVAPSKPLTPVDKQDTVVVAEPAVQAPQDVWERVRRGLAMQAVQEARVEAEINWFSQRQDYFTRVAGRAEPYFHYIVDEVERRQLPMEVALLPIVESAFQPFAYSRARAAGIWQFIPSTGLHFGLKQTWWYDGRRDIVASTKAALDYLERLHGMFNDWELAFAAYNCGEGCVQRAIARNAKAGLPTDYWNLDLPSETKGYVPRLLAVRAMVEDPARYSLSLPTIANEPYLEVVEVGSQIDLALAAELADIPLDELYLLNPGINRWATDPNGPHVLVLPRVKVDAFRAALAELPPERRIRWERHRVDQGDTLAGIARKHKTTVDVLRQVNDLNADQPLHPGQYLVVPVAGRSAAPYLASVAQQMARVPVEGYNTGVPAGARKRIHTVRSGDSLWGIARRYGVDTKDLAKWNGLNKKSIIRSGQALVVWSKSAPSNTARNQTKPKVNLAGANAKPSSGKPSKAAAGGVKSVNYTVRPGDTLYDIARKFDVTVADLRRWNKLGNSNHLRPGQRLVVAKSEDRRQAST